MRAAYEAVPSHLRRYLLGDMDAKDTAIRVAIYGVRAYASDSLSALAWRLLEQAQGSDLDRDAEGD